MYPGATVLITIRIFEVSYWKKEMTLDNINYFSIAVIILNNLEYLK